MTELPEFLRTPLLGALFGLLGGLLAFLIMEGLKTHRTRRALMQLFRDHIRESFLDVDRFRTAPTDPGSTPVTLQWLNVNGLRIRGTPEFLFEVDDLGLYETEGVKLAAVLAPKPKRQFWRCYRTLRQVEEVRRLIVSLEPEDQDRGEYQKVFKELVGRYTKEVLKLEELFNNKLGILGEIS